MCGSQVKFQRPVGQQALLIYSISENTPSFKGDILHCLLFLGKAYHKRGRLMEAFDYLEQASKVEVNPDDVYHSENIAYKDMADILHAQSHHKKALQKITASLLAVPKNISLLKKTAFIKE